jgi:hypothetical protein
MVTLSDQFGSPHFPAKNKKGWSQGKLFADPKPTDEHRYQRGYSPERMAEVKSWPMEVRSTGGARGNRQTHEVLARSTTPSSDFPDTRWGPDNEKQDPLRITTGLNGSGTGYAGVYSGNGQGVRGDILVNKNSPHEGLTEHQDRERQGQTLLHEMGHYRSAKVENAPYGNESAGYHTPEMRGREEAFADDNMMTRWRPDPRDVRAGRSEGPHPSYEFGKAFQGLGGQKAFGAYAKARQTPNVKEGESAAWDADQAKKVAEVHLNNDQFFHRDYSAESETGKPAWKVNPRHLPPAPTVEEARSTGNPLVRL